jgi:hypothetical protein
VSGFTCLLHDGGVDRFRVWGLAVVVLLGLTGCLDPRSTDAVSEPDCVTECSDRECGPDHCGGSCGACVDPLTCGPSGQCVEPVEEPPGCTQTCAEAGVECGVRCGISCGTCSGDQVACVDGVCACAPECSLASCEQTDGCGGSCGRCPCDENCENCALRLSIIDQVVQDGWVREVTLALDFQPGADQALPTMADLRLAVSGPAQLLAVGLAQALLQADKEPALAPNTGRPFRRLDGGVHQVLLFSRTNTTPIEAGRWLLLRFRLGPQSPDDAADWTTAPAVIRLVQREETFAPPPADTALWSGDYSDPVVVWADQGGSP